MARPAAFIVVALLTTAALSTTTLAAGESINDLIDKLGDPEPAVRQSAFDHLKAMGNHATQALRKAAHGTRPAIADAAAELLMAGRWWTAEDPPNLRKVLLNYGQLSVTDRAERVKKLMADRLPDYRRVVVRVLTQDPADEVGWRALEEVNGDPAWDAVLSAVDLDALPPALLLQLAKSKAHAGDMATAVKLARRVLLQEQQAPTSSGQWLSWAVRMVVDAEVQDAHFDAAADFLREQFARSDGTTGSQSDLLDQLLDLHIRYGPLPGLAEDLRRADTDSEPHSTFALALMAGRLGLPSAQAMLLSAGIADRPSESQPDRAARLSDTADWLARSGYSDAACRAYDRVTASDAPNQRIRVAVAYARMSKLHFAAGRPALAGDALQRAINNQDGPLEITNNGVREIWAMEDEQAHVYWYYLLDARARGDEEAVKKHARSLIASGSTDSSVFLDALPSLSDAASTEEVDAYFDRVFERARARVDESPAEPVFLNDLAWLCARSNRHLDEAVKWGERAIALVPNSAYLDTLAEAKFRTGKIKEAIALETKALKDQPEDEPFMKVQLDRFQKAATTRPND
ncbi:MAG: Tetratricopeptide repeat protein [Phycisphaerales bacterium]|nr:Tetratricopeptide repeat protein [Phycisphaerales bacterium]